MVMQAISNFINPYEIENKNMLYCLSSGASAPNDIEQDLFQTYQGKLTANLFKNDWLKEQWVSKLAKSTKFTGQSKKSKQITAERNIFGKTVHCGYWLLLMEPR